MAINVTATRNLMAEHYKSLGTWISLHTASPGETGTNEVTGGSPAYARKQTNWDVSATNGVVNGSECVFDVPANTTITHVGIWTAVTGGTFIDWADSADITFTPQGQVKVTPKYTQT